MSFRARLDPIVALVAQGVSVGADVLPRDVPWRLSVAAFVCDVPRFLVPLVLKHDPRLKVTESALQLGLFRSSDAAHTGFFFGPELYAYQLVYSDEAVPARHARTHEVYAHATVGYTWFPWHDDVASGWLRSLYFMPWATVGLPLVHTGGAVYDDGTTLEDRSFNWHGTVAVGVAL